MLRLHIIIFLKIVNYCLHPYIWRKYLKLFYSITKKRRPNGNIYNEILNIHRRLITYTIPFLFWLIWKIFYKITSTFFHHFCLRGLMRSNKVWALVILKCIYKCGCYQSMVWSNFLQTNNYKLQLSSVTYLDM